MARRTRAISRRFSSVLAVALALTFGTAGAGAAPAPQATSAPTGFRALSGAAAAAFSLPGDVRLIRRLDFDALGSSYERYQQYFGQAEVLGGQLTIYRSSTGGITTVIGAHYPTITPSNSLRQSSANALVLAERDLATRRPARVEGAPPADGASTEHRAVDLLIDPSTGRYFYRVEQRGFETRWMHWVDAQSGDILNVIDNIQIDHGIGVKGDTKDLDGGGGGADDLTILHAASGHGARGAHWDLASADNRQITYDAQGTRGVLFFATDDDSHWVRPGQTSPGQHALVDAQYYANVTDDYYKQRFGFDWQSCYARMQSVAHFSRNYNNAFWNGTYTVYGDGDGTVFRELSGGLDVVAHEHTHGVTECTSKLIYQNQSGALNESFSDILGNGAEFFANESLASNCVLAVGQAGCADWWLAEDVYFGTTTVPGIRNMGDPAAVGDPDHYSELFTGTADSGGVHSNSGISNHAYYLLVNGGRNAGEGRGHPHTGPIVQGIGLERAEAIFFHGFTALHQSATMCDARKATVAHAQSRYGHGSPPARSTMDAWAAVGLTATLCGS